MSLMQPAISLSGSKRQHGRAEQADSASHQAHEGLIILLLLLAGPTAATGLLRVAELRADARVEIHAGELDARSDRTLRQRKMGEAGDVDGV